VDLAGSPNAEIHLIPRLEEERGFSLPGGSPIET
jgi:hypothetical protein